MSFSHLFIPLLICLILLSGLVRKIDIADEFAKGAWENLVTCAHILPSLILLMTAVGMFTSSGAEELISTLIAPLTDFLGFPSECVSLAIVRPISGSGALAVLETILSNNSPDSFAGRTACVLMGSTETTFYTITVYFASLQKKPDPRIFFSAGIADVTGFALSALAVRIFF